MAAKTPIADLAPPTLQALAANLGRYGAREALLVPAGGETRLLTYHDLSTHVERLAAGLVAQGLEPGGRVAVMAGNSLEWVLAVLAVLRMGGVILPLDAQLGDEVLSHILDHSRAGLIFTEQAQAERLRALGLARPPRVVFLDVEAVAEESWRRLLADEPADHPAVGPDDDAALFYTSGTTGVPKGVPLTQRNIAFQIRAIEAAGFVTAAERVLLPLPLHHVYPFVIGMLTPLALGLPLILPQGLTGPELVEAMRQGRASLLIGVPRLYDALLTGITGRIRSRGAVVGGMLGGLVRLSAALRRRFGLRAGKALLWPLHRQIGPDLRIVVSGGAALKEETGLALEALGWQVATGYGLTETAPMLTIDKPGEARLGSAGRPLPGVDLRIDPSVLPEGAARAPADESGQAAGGQTSGELQACGPNVFRGYLDLPEETAHAFTSDGWFRTGDLGCFDRDGWLHIVGRVSTLIVTEGGKNIQPEEVEEAYQAHPLIAEIAVLSYEGRLVGLIVPDMAEMRRRGGDLPRAVRDAVREVSRDLPSYRRLGDFAITREPIPRTRLGKPRRHLLAAQYERARRGEERPSGQTGLVPETELAPEDRRLLEDAAARAVWTWLGERFSGQRVAPDTSLQLDLGVDSMEWLNLTLEIGQRAGVELHEDAIARIDTVRDLLREVAAAQQKGQVAVQGGAPADPEAQLGDEQRRWLEPLGPVATAAGRALHVIDRLLLRGLFRLEVRGRENLPPRGPYILAPTHSSYLDPPALGAALDFGTMQRTYWAGWTGIVFRNRLMRLFSRLARVVPIDAERAPISSLGLAGAVLRRGGILVWFPEGGRSQSGALTAFKPGIGLLIDRYRVPVVPVVIAGAHEALPVGATWPRRHPIRIHIHPPLDPDRLATEGSGASAQERIVSALHAHFRRLIGQAAERPVA
jgi:long-chain acyl-CoA synthetase